MSVEEPREPRRVVIRVPPTFDLDASAQVAREIALAPQEAELALDFGAVRVCHAFVLARLLTHLVALRRAGSTTLSNLNHNQQRLLESHGLSKVIPGTRSS